ncbi:reverse transcriptase domain-containing protein [Tanacetum coccineum]
MFAATTPENTPMAYRASNSANPNPVIIPAFVEANYEALESLLRDRRRQMRNNDLRTKLEYFSKDYDEEREMEPRPEPTRAATHPLRITSPRIRRRGTQRKEGQSVNLPPLLAAHLGRGENRQPLQSSLTSVYGGHPLPNNLGGNLPSNALKLPHANSTGKPPYGGIPAHLPQEGHAPQTFTNCNIPFQNGFTYPANMHTNSYPFYTQPMYTFPNVPVYTNPNLTGAVLNPVGSVTPFVRWIEDYPLPDGLKMHSYIDSYDRKGYPDNFLHLFKGAIRMQKWLMPVACHMFTYTLKDSARIWWKSQKAGSILDYEDLKAKFRSHFSQQNKFTKTHLAIHNIKQREGESTRAFITRYTDDTFQLVQGQDNILPLPLGLWTNKPMSGAKTPKRRSSQIRAARSPGKRGKREKRKDHWYSFRRKKKRRNEANPRQNLCSYDKQKNHNMKERPANHGRIGEITFPPLSNVGSSDPVIIKVYISGRKVNKAYLDGGSSCDVIYEHCFLKLKLSTRSLRVDSNTPLVGFSRERSWPLGEIPLEVTIGEGPIAVTKTPTFVIVKSDSPHNLLLGRTAMQQMGIVVSTVHGAIKFHTLRGIGTIFSEYNSHKPKEEDDGPTNKYQGNEENVLRCIDTEEKMVINDKTSKAKEEKPSPRKKRSDPQPAEQKAEGLHKYHLKCFLDAYKGYHQIPIAKKGEEKTTFFTREWVFCYKRLPFGLKNAGATYQKLIDKVFGHQMGRNIEVNVDDMVIKSDSEEEIMADITETLERLRAINLKLNPKNAPSE